ncbi:MULTISPECIES: hypothetical protein [Maricaulis]|uniref:hypothetical protein n=1 Tax=Maricaulis TaxID=74317 RepID=UPI003A8FC773|tara:strand:+ start:12690 stop:13256 length:567 start_codon:yes stop_codon:yes gene_type:complete
MDVNFEVEESVHGPARIADMTGLSMDGQRNWRQRGYLGPSDGPRGKMKTSAVAALAVRAIAAELGYQARESEHIGAEAGPSVLYSALLDFPLAAMKLVGHPAAKQNFRDLHERETEIARIISRLEDRPPSATITWFDQEAPTLIDSPSSAPWDGYEVTLRRISLFGIGAKLIQYAGQPLFTVTVHDPE